MVMAWTSNNSTNIDWPNYEFDGWCPGCDMCRHCNIAHLIGTRHKHTEECYIPLINATKEMIKENLEFLITTFDNHVYAVPGEHVYVSPPTPYPYSVPIRLELPILNKKDE